MREFKFRAYDKHLKLIRDVAYIDFYGREVMYYIDCQCSTDIVRDFVEVELMQSTGLKDKNGVEIYEGDVLLGHSVYPECNIFESKLIGEVYYSSRGTWDCYSYILGGFNEQVEVIGNIWEDPELLEQII